MFYTEHEEKEGDTSYSGNSPGGITMLMTSEMSLYFIIRSAEVVEVKDGEAFTFKQINPFTNQSFR